MSKSVTLKPRMSEKTYALSEERNTYVFEIPTDANKNTVARAVAAQFKVTVTGVRVAKTPGKSRRSYRRGGRVVRKGMTSGVKKAYVTLKADDKIPIFAAASEASEKLDTKEKK
ncbi:50S ribosomal protein L23 [Candidatus Saccharibacteria bacterium CG10_big_fil_rev_8_21_14_0_10_47_8]|nr:MAG: 50S ribosomal protein L23 [Candidatus Saccharibacteria bacterium CG10_big_fil_rev_8_21_14_0_10_47_8]